MTLTKPDGTVYTKDIDGLENNGDGTYSFTLKADETKDIILPANCTYTVTEADYSEEGYEATVEGVQEGTLETAQTVTFTNKLTTQKLVVSKTVDGNAGDKDKDFEFTLKVDYAYGAPATHEIEGAEMVKDGVYTFTLAHDEEITFELPYGAEYEVSEKDYRKDGYKTSVDGEEEGVMTEDTEVSYTNTRNVVQTGDNASTFPLLTFVASVLVIVLTVIRRKHFFS